MVGAMTDPEEYQQEERQPCLRGKSGGGPSNTRAGGGADPERPPASAEPNAAETTGDRSPRRWRTITDPPPV
jgi:hypothetical protein